MLICYYYNALVGTEKVFTRRLKTAMSNIFTILQNSHKISFLTPQRLRPTPNPSYAEIIRPLIFKFQ